MSERLYKPPLVAAEDDDACSEFSVISAYDDDVEDMESVHAHSIGGDQRVRVAYKEPSVNESEFVDNASLSSHPTTASKTSKPVTATSDHNDNPLLDSWNPLLLSGYVPASSVSELIDTLLKEYKENHETLQAIKSDIASLKSERVVKNEDASLRAELETLKAELDETKARIQELQFDKEEMERQFREAGKDAEKYIIRLENQLDEQCRISKTLREELDERDDELRAMRLELSTHKTIVAALQEENAISNKMARVCLDYDDQANELDKTALSLYERNETTNQQKPLHTENGIFTCNICRCDCPSLEYLQGHMLNHTQYFCHQCSFSASNEDSLEAHVQNQHAEPPTNSEIGTSQIANLSRTTSFSEVEAPSALEFASVTGSISEAEEAMSGFATPIGPQETVEINAAASPKQLVQTLPSARSQPLPSSENLIEHKMFVCACLHAFPSRGKLIAHQANCSASV